MTDIEKWLDTDPVEVALKTGDRLLADRVDILQRAKCKLPTYYSARAVFSRIAMEQSSSEAVAASRGYSGGCLAVDLTCGLGVDSLALAAHYKKVISVEIDASRAKDARNNFSLMGVSNVEVLNMSAENFISGFEGVADVIFVDPARRDKEGRRLYDIKMTQPDVVSMLPTLMEHCRELFVKCSPMFDVRELRRVFGESFTVETVSLDGECKETVVRYDGKPGCDMVTIISSSSSVWSHRFDRNMPVAGNDAPSMEYLVSFDVAIVKAGVVEMFMKEFFPGISYVKTGSYVITDRCLEMDNVLECRRILSAAAYQPAKLRKILHGRKFSVMRKGFPISMELLKRQTGICEGGNETVAFVEYAGMRYMLSLDASQ